MTDVVEAPPQQSVMDDDPVDGSGSDDEDGKKGGKSRRELPPGAVATLKAWLLSPEHFTHPYPTPQDQVLLMQKTGIDKKQLKNWFTNARRRIWKPMLKKQLEQGKLTATGSGNVAVVTMSGSVPGLMAAPQVVPTPVDYSTPMGGANTADPVGSHAMHYSQTLLANSQPQQNFDVFRQPIYNQQATHQTQTNYPGAQMMAQAIQQYSSSAYYPQTYGQQTNNSSSLANSNSIGSLPPMHLGSTPHGSMSNFNKTDSHAVLMELFARDQDLVRQATEGQRNQAAAQVRGAGESSQITNDGNSGEDFNQTTGGSGGGGIHQIASQHPMKMGGSGNKALSGGSLNSWPHFSSVSSLNNLATMTGVKSITNMSSADLVSQGSLNKKGNLAQVKSIESMGRADSYAFLEVFFDNSTSAATGMNHHPRGVKREREEDNDVGLSLDADESPSNTTMKPNDDNSGANNVCSSSAAPVPAPLPDDGKDTDGLKHAFDEARAAHGLISVSRSSEKLTDLVLPAKMQRTLSQGYLKPMNLGGAGSFGSSFGYSMSSLQSSSGTIHTPPSTTTYQQSRQYPGQTLQQQQQYHGSTIGNNSSNNVSAPLSDPSATGASVEVPSTTRCSLCQCINVDTQLRPCGHMFHGRCLKPSLQNAMGPPKCPIDYTPMQSAVLAVPTDEKTNNNNNSNNNNTNAFQSHMPNNQPPVKCESPPNGNNA